MSADVLAALARRGELRRAGELAGFPDTTGLVVSPELAALLPWPRLRRGATVAIAPGTTSTGATSLLLALLAAVSHNGAWCALVGAGDLSPVAAAQAGVSLSRLALVPDPADRCEAVTGALLDGVDVVAVQLCAAPRPSDAQRLMARARRRDAVLVPFGPGAAGWPGADAAWRVDTVRWLGLRAGGGLLRHCELSVSSRIRGRRSQGAVWPYGRPEETRNVAVRRLAPVVRPTDHRDGPKGVRSARTRGAVSGLERR